MHLRQTETTLQIRNQLSASEFFYKVEFLKISTIQSNKDSGLVALMHCLSASLMSENTISKPPVFQTPVNSKRLEFISLLLMFLKEKSPFFLPSHCQLGQPDITSHSASAQSPRFLV